MLESVKNGVIVSDQEDEQKKLVDLRRRVNRLYFEEGYSKNSIVVETGMSKQFVVDWTQSSDQDFDEDKRGWPVGKRRVWPEQTVDRLLKIHDRLESSTTEFFSGATAVFQEWKRQYQSDPPPLRTIGQILKDNGRTKPRRKKAKGAAAYLGYPDASLGRELGRMIEADFIGPRYLKGSSKPLHFVGFSAKKDPKFRYYARVEGQSYRALRETTETVFERFEKPHALKVDNAVAATGSNSGQRILSQMMMYLLEREVVPVFSVPRKPFSQASIEGNNSVFSRKFWNRRTFLTRRSVDAALRHFNDASLRYSGYQSPPRKEKPFELKVVFLRQVGLREGGAGERGSITVLNEEIPIPKSYLNQFVWAEWRLKTEKLHVRFEVNQRLRKLKTVSFPINPKSKEKAVKSGLLSSCR